VHAGPSLWGQDEPSVGRRNGPFEIVCTRDRSNLATPLFVLHCTVVGRDVAAADPACCNASCEIERGMR